MGLYQALLRPILFRLDPERAHHLGMTLLSRGLVPSYRFENPSLERTFFGVKFKNPLGLAAGFDKNGVALNHWRKLGFGFIEAGTVTWHGQPGNPLPRMFRLPQDGALINRMGFNNDGAAAFATQARAARAGIPLGINLGKSKVTPVEDAASDYAQSYSALHGLGDYFVINVSSPNTPGLRSLQERGPLEEIISVFRAIDGTRPLFVKVAPDLTDEALCDVADVARTQNLTGLIATNTTVSRSGLVTVIDEAGGLSGRPLAARSDEVLALLRRELPGKVLIGVGGVFTGADLARKLALGADLVQIYTGFIYGGPAMPTQILREFCAT